MSGKNRFGGLILPVHVRKQLGATGKFPNGKLNDNDEGEIKIAIGIVEDNVVIDFGKPIRSLAMPPENARGFAQLILDKAAMAAMPDDDNELGSQAIDESDGPDDDFDEELSASDERDTPDEVESSDGSVETESEADSSD